MKECITKICSVGKLLKMQEKAKINALPIGLRGKFYGMPYNVIIQYDFEGKVSAEIYGGEGAGVLIVSISGNKKDIPHEVSKLTEAIIEKGKHPRAFYEDKKGTIKIKEVEKFIKEISGEVHDYNTGKSKHKQDRKPTSEFRYRSTEKDVIKKEKPHKVKKHKPMKHKKLKRKKKKGSVIKYIDKKGHANHTYEIKRDKEGHFDKFKQIAGAGGYKNTTDTEIGALTIDIEKRLKAGAELLAIAHSNVAFFKSMQKTSPEKRSYYKVMLKLEKEKIKKINKTLRKLKKSI